MKAQSFQLFPCRDGINLAYCLMKPQQPSSSDVVVFPVVMVCGFTGVMGDWDVLPHLLSRSRPVAMFDNRGMGDSYVSSMVRKSEQRLSDFSDSAVDLLDHLGWKKAIFFGHSFGGMICQHVALRYPNRVAGLILLGTTDNVVRPPSPAPATPIGVALSAVLEEAAKKNLSREETKREGARVGALCCTTAKWAEQNKESFFKLIERSVGEQRPQRGMMLQAAALKEWDGSHRVEEIFCPTLVIHGEEDGVIHVECGKRVAKKIGGSTLVVMKGMGHNPHWMGGTGEMMRHIVTFLNKVDKGTRQIKAKL